MKVVGGWPGRRVVGLNGRFGVRPADFARLGDFPNPFENDVDAGDATTEFVGVVLSLPASGTITFDDFGGFTQVGSADGVHVTTFQLYSWKQGGPITKHEPPSTITVVSGAIPLNAPLIANATAIYSPVVAPGPVGVGAPHIVNAQAFFGFSVSTSVRSLQAPLVSSPAAAFAPVVSLDGQQIVAPPLFSNPSACFAPSVVPGPATLAPSLLANTQTFFAPGVSLAGGGGAGATAAQIWSYVLPNGLTAAETVAGIHSMLSAQTKAQIAEAVREELATELLRVVELAEVHGLMRGVPMINDAAGRRAGSVVQTITEFADGTTVTERV